MDLTSTLAVNPEDLGLLTDLYQLTMTACYAGERDRRGQSVAHTPACFELFARRLPQPYSYLIAMGLEQALGYLETLHFGPQQLDALRHSGIFDQAPALFWQLLETLRFSGDVWAVSEGTAVFAQEPLLRVEAPLWQAQLVETYLLNTLNYQTLIATRAARLRDVAGAEASLLEFGSRRAFSPQGAVWAARAAIAGGLSGTSNVLAALQLGQQPRGTMAHSLVMALAALEGSEADAFAAFHRSFPGAPLLIDTYDPIRAAEQLAEAVRSGAEIPAVRLDSGDLAALSKQVRSLLPETQIFVSGDLDEGAIAQLKAQNAPIDGYGLGTKLVTGAPVNGVYKLVEIDGIPVMKEATGKRTYPGRKQVYRQFDRSGKAIADRLALASESAKSFTIESSESLLNGAETEREQPLLTCVMRGGVRQTQPEPLEAIARRTAQSVASLPKRFRDIGRFEAFPVVPSSALNALTERTQADRSSSTDSSPPRVAPRIALFGTSADPPTLGHQKILAWLSQTYDAVWVWASDNPFKQHPVDLQHRTAMLRRCVDELSCRNLEVDSSLSSPRSLTTLERAQARSPQASFTLVIGSDLAAQIPSWYRAEALLSQVQLLIVPRPGFPLDSGALDWLRQNTQNKTVAIAPIQGPPVSSSQYRRGEPGDRRDVVSPAVQTYIEQEDLYSSPVAPSASSSAP